MSAFACDMHRAFANATKYNPRGSHLHECALNLRARFVQRLRQVKWDDTLAMAALMHTLLDALENESELVHFTTLKHQPADFVKKIRLTFINAIVCNSVKAPATYFTAKKLLAIFEAGLVACRILANHATTLRDAADSLYAATESYFFRKSTNPKHLETFIRDIESGIISTPGASQTALDIIVISAILYNPDPTHTIHAAALAFNCLGTEAVNDARGDNLAVHRTLETVLDDIMVDPLARRYFNIQCPLRRYDHDAVIQRPTNLGAVATRLACGHYTHEHVFAEDVRYVFSNGKLQNVPAGAEHLKAFFACKLKGAITCPKVRAREAASRRFCGHMKNCFNDAAMLPVGDMRHILRVLRTRRPASDFFLRPITPPIPGLEDYERIISRPVDLNTIEERLKTYTTRAAFAHDIRCMFRNALKLVPDPALAVHQAASILLKLFENELNSAISSRYPRNQTHAKTRLSAPKPPTDLACPPFLGRTFPLLYPSSKFPQDASDPRHVEMAESWQDITNELGAWSSNANRPFVDSMPMAPWRRDPGVLGLLWQSSCSESLARRDATVRDTAVREQAMLDDSNREEQLREERLAEIERDCEAQRAQDTRSREKDLQQQRGRDEARQRAREEARRHREELEQTVDLDQQRIAVSSFLEQAITPSGFLGFGARRSNS